MIDWYAIALERYKKRWMTLEQLNKLVSHGWIKPEQKEKIISQQRNNGMEVLC